MSAIAYPVRTCIYVTICQMIKYLHLPIKYLLLPIKYLHLPIKFLHLPMFRDRPFNLKGYGFLFRSEFFSNTRVRIFFFLSRKAQIFFPEFNIRLYDKNSESDYFFFPPPKLEYFFQQHWESECFFRKKPYPPSPPPFKLNGHSLIQFVK